MHGIDQLADVFSADTLKDISKLIYEYLSTTVQDEAANKGGQDGQNGREYPAGRGCGDGEDGGLILL
ncbi:MAG: hypothetical protein EBV45_15515 [Chloroflexi bacterium]|nr:hypothetical protein [Chloroflexota bacterium]